MPGKPKSLKVLREAPREFIFSVAVSSSSELCKLQALKKDLALELYYENKTLDSSSWLLFQQQQFKIMLLRVEVRRKNEIITVHSLCFFPIMVYIYNFLFLCLKESH